MTKRLLNYGGFALLVLPMLAAVVLQLRNGDLVSFPRPQVISEKRSKHMTVIVSQIDMAVQWKTVLPLLAAFQIGVVCLIIAHKTPASRQLP